MTEDRRAITEQPLQKLAEAPEFAPFASSQAIPLLWVMAIATLGGVVSFIRKYRDGTVRAFNIIELFGEVVVSIFVGLVTYWLCRAYSIGEWETAAAIAVSSHMGTRAVFTFEKWLEIKFPRKA